MTRIKRIPELLAPVGNMEMCHAAVHNGADAIYVGFPGFNARGRTMDHSWEDLEEMIRFCHLHRVKVFLALNVLIFEKELRQLQDELPRALALRPDAIIVQDQGLARLIRFICPTQTLHASTQMTVTNHEHIALTEDLGLQRYVLGREVSLEEMAIIRGQTDKELEVFVHGALCVAYSGQCLTSEGFGGRSANRGQCAQSCRMEYDLIVDGERRDLGSLRYLVSPKDLCGLEDIPKLIELGIDSFKIEGRLKTPQYVATTASAYKHAMQANATKTEMLRNLTVTYSRGFFNGWLGGVNHQRLVDGRYGSHRGLEIGSVVACRGNTLEIASEADLHAGDGLLFVDYASAGKKANTPAESWGARIFSAEVLQKESETKEKNADSADLLPEVASWEVTFSNDFQLGHIPIGSTAYLNDSPLIEREATRSYTDKSRWKTSPLWMRLEGNLGEPLRLTVSDGNIAVTTATKVNLEAARNPATALTLERAGRETGGLAGTGFHLESCEFTVGAGLYITDKEIRKARQEALLQLQSILLETRQEVALKTSEATSVWLEREALSGLANLPVAIEPAHNPHLNLLIREMAALDWLAGLPLHTVYLEFEHGKDYKAAIGKVRSLGFQAGIVTTRILKPSEYHNLKVIESLAPDVVLVRNLGALQYLSGKGLNLVGDFSLNVTNSLTASYLLGKGLKTLCPSYDLNQWQLLDLLDTLGGRHFEITVHQYLPSFHMEHCVFAALLSQGTSFKDCGKPCEKHRVELRDHTGALHPLKADQECRNTMFNGKPQSAARLVPSLMTKGVTRFRVEALYENEAILRTKVIEYARLVSGASTPEAVFANMGVVEKYGVMEGQLRNTHIHSDRKKSPSKSN